MNGLRSQRRRDHTSPATSTNMARSPQPTGYPVQMVATMALKSSNTSPSTKWSN